MLRGGILLLLEPGSSGFTNVEKGTKSITAQLHGHGLCTTLFSFVVNPHPAVAEEIQVDLQELKKGFMDVLC